MRICDPHIHLWDTRAIYYPWLTKPRVAFSGDNRLLPQVYDVAELLRDAHDVDVLGTVNIEANPADPVAEARWLQSLADDPTNQGHPHGIVAYADLSRHDAPETIKQLTSCPNLRGIRQILNVHVDPRYNYADRNYLTDHQWLKNLELLADHGLSFDLQIYPDQAPAMSEVIESHPGIRFIINHTGMFVDRRTVNGWREWRSGLRMLARHENAAIKLSGLAMFDHSWTVESFRPLVLEAIDCFGTERCMFASNFPIDGLHASYRSLWHGYAEVTSGASAVEHDALFVSNAIRYYRLSSVTERRIYGSH